MRIAATSVVGAVLREQPDDPRWRAHDVSQLLGVDRRRLHELARQEGVDRRPTWSPADVGRLLARQLRDGTSSERERAAEAIRALGEPGPA